MPAALSCCDDLQCPHSGSNRLPKHGCSRGKQTCRRRLCHYRFTPDGNRHCHSEHIKEQATEMYGEGMAVAAISRVLAVNLGAVYEWVKKVRWELGIWAWVTMHRRRWALCQPYLLTGCGLTSGRGAIRSGRKCGSGRR